MCITPKDLMPCPTIYAITFIYNCTKHKSSITARGKLKRQVMWVYLDK